MAEEYKSESEQVAWNLSQQLIFQIGHLLQRASQNYVTGYMDKCYFDVREIRTLIFADLSKEEIIELKTLEGKITNAIAKSRSKISSKPTEEEKKYRAIQNLFLSRYRERMMELLSKYGYLISKKQDSSRMF